MGKLLLTETISTPTIRLPQDLKMFEKRE